MLVVGKIILNNEGNSAVRRQTYSCKKNLKFFRKNITQKSKLTNSKLETSMEMLPTMKWAE
jgi:hypothetical protein